MAQRPLGTSVWRAVIYGQVGRGLARGYNRQCPFPGPGLEACVLHLPILPSIVIALTGCFFVSLFLFLRYVTPKGQGIWALLFLHSWVISLSSGSAP